MGISLFYMTTSPASAAVRTVILDDAKRINHDRRWWCESMIFFGLGRDKENSGDHVLFGDTKFFLGGYSHGDGQFIEVDSDDEHFMAFRDAAFILHQLARWSTEHGVGWTLNMGDAEVGMIVGGKVQPPGLFGSDRVETEADERRAVELDAKYASRSAE